MRLRWANRIVAAATAAALLSSGGAQAFLLLGCASPGTHACCLPKDDPAAAKPARYDAGERACCSMTPAPARHEDATPQATIAQNAPVLVALAATPLPASALETAIPARAVDPPRSAGPPILRTTCSLLI